MRGTGILSGALVCAALLGATPLWAADPAQAFVERASATGLGEIEAAKLALGRSRAADVKTFAVHLVDDHTKTNVQLKTLAESRQLKLADGPDAATRERLKTLAASPDDAFDAAFAQAEAQAYEQTLKLYGEAAEHAEDPDIRQFAQTTLAVLRLHLEMARQLAEAHPAR